VRETGGLRDTVLSHNDFTGEGNGFTFFNYNAHDMLHTIERAVDFYRNQPDIWVKLQNRGMEGDYSWTHSAGEYMKLYQAALEGKKETEPAPEPEENPVVMDV
jgi:starch synthase